MRRGNKTAIVLSVAVLLLSFGISLAQTTSSSSAYGVLIGTAVNLPPNTQIIAPTPPSTLLEGLTLTLKQTPEQQAALQQLLNEQQNPSSSNYHQWITPQQYGEQFGASEVEINSIVQWLSANDLAVTYVANGRNFLNFKGTIGQIESAFHVHINDYVVDGRQCWASPDNQSVPIEFVSIIGGVSIGAESLSNCFPPQPQSVAPISSRSPNPLSNLTIIITVAILIVLVILGIIRLTHRRKTTS